MAFVWRPNEQGLDVVCEYEPEHPWTYTNTYIPEDVVADVLMYAAVDVESIGCKDEWCEECNPMRTAWWRAMNSLSVKTRQATQALMRDAGVALVPGPYDVVDIHAIPTAQHG
jgi:hypothetical protein